MKKIINDSKNVVSEMLKGLEKSCDYISYIPEVEVIHRKDLKEKVAIISGGGSGHEPAHAGYVGYGMLDAAVAGNVFASPSPDRIIKAIETVQKGKGVLLVIKNYSGDIMNFEMAMDLAKDMDIEVDAVIVKDDVSVEDSTFSTGRRGIAGTVFVHKIAGAKAEKLFSLQEVKATAEKVINNVRSMGVALNSCILPGVGKPVFEISDDEIEIGMGIHGEPGINRNKKMTSREIAERLVESILKDYDYTNSETAILVNGLGGTPLMELYIINNDIHDILLSKGIKIYKTFVGNYMTSLEMAGCSLSILKLDDELKELLDYSCKTPALNII